MALNRRQIGTDLLHHPDRGSQYTSNSYRVLLTANGITVSLSRKGDWLRQRVDGIRLGNRQNRVRRASRVRYPSRGSCHPLRVFGSLLQSAAGSFSARLSTSCPL